MIGTLILVVAGIAIWAQASDDNVTTYRAVYALRTAYDRQPVLTVSAAIAYGELTLRMDRLRMPADPTASAR